MSVFNKSGKTNRTPPKNQNKIMEVDTDTFKSMFEEMQDKFLNTFSTKISEMSESIKNVESVVTSMTEKEKNYDKNISIMDRERRKRNIIIKGIPEKESDIGELEKTVLKFINDQIKVSLSIQEIDNILRLGKKSNDRKYARPILLKLTTERKKLEILRNKFNLKGTIFFVDNDYSKETVHQKFLAREEIRRNKPSEATNKRQRSIDDLQ
jgi:translation initiation factor 1 (eIF-1/SUI1)